MPKSVCLISHLLGDLLFCFNQQAPVPYRKQLLKAPSVSAVTCRVMWTAAVIVKLQIQSLFGCAEVALKLYTITTPLFFSQLGQKL